MKVSARLLFGASLLLSLAAQASAPAALTFVMKDPKGVSGLSISIDSPLEPVHGYANGLSGSIAYDPARPAQARGTIVVDMNSLFVGNQAMTESMRQDWCLDTNKFPTAKFVVKKIDRVSTKKGVSNLRVHGDFTLHGVTKPLVVLGTATYQANMIKKRGGMENVQGDLLTIRTQFSFKRSDFGIAKGLSKDVIGDLVTVTLSSVGVCPR